MYAHVVSLGVTGLDGYPVTVETHISGGLPKFAMVGLPDSAVKESSERVRSAIKNLNCPWPASHVTVNLAPADVRKTGSLYDLPVFIGILAAQQYIPQPEPHQAFLGELGLDGTLRPIAGALPMALAAQKAGLTELFVPAENAAEAAEAGFVNLKGHRLVGGMRASIYNAMPAEGVDKLVDFMEKFRKENA